MKDTKRLFLMAFFACFMLPLIIVLFATVSIFYSKGIIVSFSNWVLFDGGI